jgi:pyrroline-5-carboxylate reductase
MEKKIGFIGAGNIAEALIRGLLETGVATSANILASAPRAERAAELRKRFEIEVTGENQSVAERAEILILSVKPQILPSVLSEIGGVMPLETLIISVAAGIPTSRIEDLLGGRRRVIRTMPNTPVVVQAGATALARGIHATAEDLEVARTIFNAVGVTVDLDESLMDAVTGLSGSGPAYVFLILEALSDAGVKVGLSRRTSQLLAAQTVLGSAKLLLETQQHPGVLKDMVTSPGGTAITGLHTLEHGGVRTTLIDAVEAATRRSRELGQQLARPETLPRVRGG